METVQLTIEEYEDKQPLEDGEFIDKIQKEHPTTYGKVLKGLQEIGNIMNEIEGYNTREYTEDELKMIFTSTDFAEAFDEEYLEEHGKSILINYRVYDEVGTDKGIWHITIANGYELLEA